MKKLHKASLVGQKGINLIEQLFIEMGQVWRPTSIHDTGIDGTLELRNSVSGEATNLHLQVQSKATEGSFESESDITFIFRPTENDLAYWLNGNIPVLLVVSRPATKEAYWVSVKDYFSDDTIRTNRQIIFDKRTQRLDADALPHLWALAASSNAAGVYQAPIPMSEDLLSNLLPVSRLPDKIYHAIAIEKDIKKFSAVLRDHGNCREWTLKAGNIISVHDLRQAPFVDLCEQGTVEEIPTKHWSESDDPNVRKDFVALMNNCLRAKLELNRVWFQHRKPFRLYYFAAPEDFSTRKYAYISAQHRTNREVFRAYYKRKDGTLLFYRHSAMKAQFYQFQREWFLEVTPTYYFTYKDGRAARFYEDYLSGIKRLERNNAVRGQLLMWASLLTHSPDLLETDYQHLAFAAPMRFSAPVLIDDDAWRPQDDFDNEGQDQSVLDEPGRSDENNEDFFSS